MRQTYKSARISSARLLYDRSWLVVAPVTADDGDVDNLLVSLEDESWCEDSTT